MSSHTEIRYSRVNLTDYSGKLLMQNVPKNTLSTQNHRDRIFFGIARCNLIKDKCNKDVGSRIASNRAKLAFELFDDEDSDFILDSQGLYGSVKQNNISKLLDYFYSLED